MKGVTEVMKVLTVKKTFYLEWRSLCLAGINCSLIRYRWDLWEEWLFSLCQLTSHFSVSACTELAAASKIQYTQYYMTLWLFSAFKSQFLIWQLHFGVLVYLASTFSQNILQQPYRNGHEFERNILRVKDTVLHCFTTMKMLKLNSLLWIDKLWTI